MCRLFYNLGFRGKYIIFDLAPFAALQRYYLQATGIAVCTFDGFQFAESGVICISDMRQLKKLIAVDGPRGYNDSLVVATWSISEAPLDLRDEVMSQVSEFRSFLFAYQDTYGGVDNDEYFRKVKHCYPEIEWKQWVIDHLPGNHYLVGHRVGK